jgi:hypothetical protein
MMFLVYLGGMIVVFVYTTAMAIENYLETWGSNVVIWGASMLGLFVELVFLVLLVKNDEVDVLGVFIIQVIGLFIVVRGWNILIEMSWVLRLFIVMEVD